MATSSTSKKRFHPDGVARLVASIVAYNDVEGLMLPPRQKVQAYRAAVMIRMDAALSLARAYYRNNPQDFEDAGDWRSNAVRNGTNNLAHLDRASLLPS
jgi:hypothetical protein